MKEIYEAYQAGRAVYCHHNYLGDGNDDTTSSIIIKNRGTIVPLTYFDGASVMERNLEGGVSTIDLGDATWASGTNGTGYTDANGSGIASYSDGVVTITNGFQYDGHKVTFAEPKSAEDITYLCMDIGITTLGGNWSENIELGFYLHSYQGSVHDDNYLVKLSLESETTTTIKLNPNDYLVDGKLPGFGFVLYGGPAWDAKLEDGTTSNRTIITLSNVRLEGNVIASFSSQIDGQLICFTADGDIYSSDVAKWEESYQLLSYNSMDATLKSIYDNENKLKILSNNIDVLMGCADRMTVYKVEDSAAGKKFYLREKGLYIFGGSDYDLNLCDASGNTIGKTDSLVIIIFCTEADVEGRFRVYVMQNYKNTLGISSMDGMPYYGFTKNHYVICTQPAYVYYMRQGEI